ncbi:hypothetical protein P3W85_34000 [Cupriavidus basilensis]|uniref:Uncharacterized protein n=1 Tax=Cupriavidus basilensis TaxID=68895 RepID=A0ABT6AZ68_9BURK|nr:hypothetical protein [Cupriavidus basilensis]MDF3837910.1 hypothetical protein [Cupriavidus basilensis]
MPQTFECRTSLPGTASAAWRRATTAQGIDDELFPWLCNATLAGLKKTMARRPQHLLPNACHRSRKPD